MLPIPSIIRPLSIFLLLIPWIATHLHSRDIDTELVQEFRNLYENKTFIIRNFYGGKHLKYDSEGALISKPESGPWSLNGYLKIYKFVLQEKKLEITGKRLFWSYDGKEKRSRYIESSGKTRIEIERSDISGDADSLQKALLRIFMSNNEPLQDAVPHYWEYFVTKEFGIHKNEVEESQLKQLPPCNGDGFVNPKSLSQPLPPYTSIAEKAKHSGKVHITAIVNKEGRVVVKDIITPLGLGLDESAVDTISKKWEFVPASQHGVPVDCEVDIEVVFSPYIQPFPVN